MEYIRKRLDSILNQDYMNVEVLLLDDASVDGSRDTLIEFSRQHQWPVHLNTENSGSPFRQWEKGVSMATGEFVWIAESDDYCEPTLLSTLIEILDSDKAITLAYCQSTYIDENNKEIGSAKVWTDSLDEDRWANDYVSDGKREAVEWLSCRNTIPNASAVVFRRSAWPSIDDIKDMRLCGDWIVWGRIARKGKVAFSVEPLNYFRVHAQTVRTTTKRKRQSEEWYCAVKENLESSDNIPLNRTQIQRMIRSWLETVDFDARYLMKYTRMVLGKSKTGVIHLVMVVVLRSMKSRISRLLRPYKTIIDGVNN